MNKSAAQVLASIKARCTVTQDGCWLWQGYATAGGHPMMHACLDGRRGTMYVRRVALACVGRAPGPRVPVVPTCGDKGCCNPAHQEATTPSAVAQGVAQRSRSSAQARAEKIALARRAQSKLTQEAVQQIRAGGGPAREAAQQHGVSRGAVYAIRQGRAWRGA